jgi:multidrug efflux pump subunit AcrA (membrane-fusion protein)
MKKILLAILPVIIVAGCRGSKTQNPEALPAAVTTVKAVLKEVTTVVDVSGKIWPKSQVQVFALVPGKVQETLAEEGDLLKKGALLARVRQEAPGSDFKPSPVEAPLAGVVLRKMTEAGAMVTPQTPLFEMADLGCLTFKGQIFGQDIKKIRPGQRMMITGSGQDTLVGLTVSKLAPQLDPATGGLTIEASICLYKNALLPGQAVEGHVVTGISQGLTVPRSSVVRDSLGREGVFLPANDIATFTPVKITTRSTDHFTVEGLEPGQEIVFEGASGLNNGQRIRIVVRR